MQTLHAGPKPIKWIGTRSYDGRFCAANHLVLPIHIRRNALGHGIPARDLFVSPGHAIFYAGALIPASRLVNGTSITQLAAVNSVTYFHIELNSHEILFAENCPAESFLDQDFRAQFHNAAAFHRLYPAAAPALACLPRVESGFGLQSIQRRLGFAQTPASGPLRGFIDQAGPQTVSGWAQTIASPESPVCLDILCAGRRIARVLANRYRADLKKAGIGTGHHGFELSLPAGASLPITVRCAATHAVLPCTEAALAA